MIKFLGSLYFALMLIGCTLIFVIVGTFLESKTESHGFASSFTYQNPIFQLLLWLYFINILVSALNRYPFQKKHIPFLLTHLGLLLLLLGVFVKNHFGIQGACALSEGCATSEIFLPHSYALHVENRERHALLDLKKDAVGPLVSSIDDLELTVLEWTPHVQEHLEGFIKGKWGHILGMPLFEVKQLNDLPSLTTPEYQIYAYMTDQLEGISFPGKASLFFTKDNEKKEHLIAFNEQGEKFTQDLTAQTYLIFNKGYGGYALFAELPANFFPLELVTPLTKAWTPLPLPQKREDATPGIRLLARSGNRTEIVSLIFDQYGQKFKWPILGGSYLLRFQLSKKKIPLHLRLRQAKQINYLGTNQPFSYEAQVLFDQDEATLSMNHVYEKKGYRFYLANLLAAPSGINQVQIVVNYDPAKYILTYPGAIILACGIILLYFRKRHLN